MSKKLVVKLRTGEKLKVKKLGLSGYVIAPVGGKILGGSPSREHVGKFCIGVKYLDGDTGIIAQEEIAEITDAKGKPVPYGDPKYPGHPEFDPRDSFDPMAAQIQSMRWMSQYKRKSSAFAGKKEGELTKKEKSSKKRAKKLKKSPSGKKANKKKRGK